jgi:hypothetical protein
MIVHRYNFCDNPPIPFHIEVANITDIYFALGLGHNFPHVFHDVLTCALSQLVKDYRY